MERNLYSVQDVMIGFMNPELMPNDEAAIREYNNFLKATKNPTDMRLFKIGVFNDSTGEIDPITPICLAGGGEQNE